MRLLRRATAKANELVLEITEQSADRRRFDRRLPIERQKGREPSRPGSCSKWRRSRRKLVINTMRRQGDKEK
jgi:hypothetical protein